MPDNVFIGYDLSFRTGALHFPESLFFQSRAMVQGSGNAANHAKRPSPASQWTVN
ncbi:hypothetical protein N8616_03940 [Verrucomicrobia bacterium]|nr:hypothetical protein [Verrucomicrobiota bacterium]